jgi:hypothetical protein
MRRLVAFALIALTGCGVGGDGKTIDQSRVHDLVLNPSDVGAGFQRTFIEDLGRDATVEARYRRVPPRLLGPLAIGSAASVFASSDAAEKALDAKRSTVEDKPNWQPIGEPGLGDESFAATAVQGRVRSYTVSWRDDNATASLDVRSLQKSFPFADVFELAERQQRRIAAAAELGARGR